MDLEVEYITDIQTVTLLQINLLHCLLSLNVYTTVLYNDYTQNLKHLDIYHFKSYSLSTSHR